MTLTQALFWQKYTEQLSSQLRELEDRLHETDAKYEKRQRVLREELDLRRRTELHQLAETKNAHINRLVADHEKAFADMKNYYNDITLNNLALINTLKVGALPASSCVGAGDLSQFGQLH